MRFLKGVTFSLIAIFLLQIGCSTIGIREPVFKGKYLTDWLCCEPPGAAQTQAILGIGTNALPILLDLLGATDGTARKVAGRLSNRSVLSQVRQDGFQISELTDLAIKGFTILGTNAEPAVPQMAKLMDNDETVLQATEALALVGPKGFSVLTNALVSDNPSKRACAASALTNSSGDPKLVTQLILPLLHDKEAGVRASAAQSLAGRDPGQVVSALIPLLDDHDNETRQNTILTLGTYGPAAKAAGPKLLAIYTNAPDDLLFQSLKTIDMDSAVKAEEFFMNTGPLNQTRHAYTRTVLRDGKELIAGGAIHREAPVTSNFTLANAYLRDLKTGAWTETGPLNEARRNHTATLLSDGRVLVVGGLNGTGQRLSSAEIYDPVKGIWVMTNPVNLHRPNQSATLLKNGNVLVYSSTYQGPIYDVEEYNPTTEKWTVTNLTAVPR